MFSTVRKKGLAMRRGARAEMGTIVLLCGGNSRLTLPFLYQQNWQRKGLTECWHSLVWRRSNGSEPYHRRFDAYARLEIGVLQDVEQEICPPLCSTFRGKVMGQNGVLAKLCVRKTIVDSSIQAQFAGDFMRQKW
jgi:hypothetical protein